MLRKDFLLKLEEVWAKKPELKVDEKSPFYTIRNLTEKFVGQLMDLVLPRQGSRYLYEKDFDEVIDKIVHIFHKIKDTHFLQQFLVLLLDKIKKSPVNAESKDPPLSMAEDIFIALLNKLEDLKDLRRLLGYRSESSAFRGVFVVYQACNKQWERFLQEINQKQLPLNIPISDMVSMPDVILAANVKLMRPILLLYIRQVIVFPVQAAYEGSELLDYFYKGSPLFSVLAYLNMAKLIGGLDINVHNQFMFKLEDFVSTQVDQLPSNLSSSLIYKFFKNRPDSLVHREERVRQAEYKLAKAKEVGANTSETEAYCVSRLELMEKMLVVAQQQAEGSPSISQAVEKKIISAFLTSPLRKKITRTHSPFWNQHAHDELCFPSKIRLLPENAQVESEKTSQFSV